MNRTDVRNGNFDSGFGTGIGRMYPGAGLLERGRPGRGQALRSRAAAIRRALCGGAVRRLARAGGVVLALLGMIGAAGAMERGTLPLGAGLLICAALLGVEFLCLRTRNPE